MQALILAAGVGKRLRPITEKIPKCLVEVNGTPLIINQLEALSNHNEIKEVIIAVGYKQEMIKNKIGNYYNGIKITYVSNDSYDKTNNIYSLWLAANKIREDFILMEGDIYFEHKLLNIIFQNRNKNIMLVSKYQSYMDGTVIEINEGDRKVKKLIPSSNQGKDFNYINTYKTLNIYSITYNFFSKYFKPNIDLYIKTHGTNSYYELILGVLIYLNTPDIEARIVEDTKWYEIDDLNDLNVATYMFSEEKDKIKQISNLHGGYWRFDFIDFCYLFNLYFPSETLYCKLAHELTQLVNNYPSAQHNIATLLSRWYKEKEFTEKNLIVGNGASEFIRILNKNMVNKITIPVPTFNEYENQLPKEKINYYQLKEDNDFCIDKSEFIKSIRNSKSNFAVIINPNNPISTITRKEDIEYIIKSLRTIDGIIVDESFIDFTMDRDKFSVQPLIKKYKNLIVLRSLSKEFGIPGLRIGYIVTTNERVKSKIKEHLPIWNINSVAERFIELFIKYREGYIESIKKISEDRRYLYTGLKSIDYLKPFKPYANFVFCKITNNRLNSEKLTEKLFIKYRILIKDCSNKTSLENKRYVRISVRKRRDNFKLLNALKEINVNNV